MNPSKKLQVYTYTLIIAVLRLQLTVDSVSAGII